MKERPILLNAEMVRAVLDGRKTQTRRMLTPRQLKMIDAAASIGECYPLDSGLQHENSQSYYREWCPFGAVGDRLWVRERARVVHRFGNMATIKYEADGFLAAVPMPERVKPVPVGRCLSNGCYREASRIMLEITGVRVERLQDISDSDVKAEGCWYGHGGEEPDFTLPPNDHFPTLWASIYGEESWQANPFVWVIEFKQVEANHDN